MNKFLLVGICTLLVLKLTFELIDAATFNGKPTSNSQPIGVKRYALINIHFNLYFFFFFNSIPLQPVPSKSGSVRGRHYRPTESSNPRSKRSAVTTPPTDILLDEQSGVRVLIFVIYLI
jgi:hypothetical protein